MENNAPRKILCVGTKKPGKRPDYLCIHPGDDGGICGWTAKVYDPLRGGMVCLNHAPKTGEV